MLIWFDIGVFIIHQNNNEYGQRAFPRLDQMHTASP